MNRSTFALSLVAACAVAALGAPALAQNAAPAPAAAPAQPPAAAAPATPPAAGAPAAATPAAAAPAAPAAEAPAPPPPVLPTSGDGAVVDNVLTSVCVPLANGGNFQALMKANGFKQDSKTQDWVKPLSQKPYAISLTDPGSINKGICEMDVKYAPGWDQPIIDGLNVWRFLQSPQLHGQRSDKMVSKDYERVTTTWDNWENQMIDGKMVGLVLVQLNKPDGTAAINPSYDEALVRYQIRKAQLAEGVIDPVALAAQEAAAKEAAAKAAAAAAAAQAAAAAAAAAQPAQAQAPATAPAAPAT